MTRPIAITIMGPTAAGKTRLAFHLHERFPVDIISVDAAQVYRGMDIGTAKPTLEEQRRVPHRLIDICDPAESYSAAEFCTDALRHMKDISERGRIPMLVGGTMFYFHALEKGLSNLPSANADVRAQLAAQAAQIGWPAMHAKLATLDPVAAARISPNDAQRIQRALEVIEISGETLTALNQRTPPEPPPFDFIHIALMPSDRAWLHAQIARRFNAMLELGLVAEVETLYRRTDLHPHLPSMRTVGYLEVWEYLTGKVTYNQMTERAVAATRQLAKRQLTWLRRYQGRTFLLDCTEAMENLCQNYLQQRVRGRD